jgi:hypothetical protein
LPITVSQLLFRGRLHIPALRGEEREGRDRVHLVVRAVHDELHASGNLTELANDQSIANKIIVMRDVFFEIDIAEIGEITNDDAGIVNCWTNMRDRRTVFYRIHTFRIWFIIMHL